jgi:hypothetical protein
MRFENRSRSVERFRRPGQIARGERDFSLGYRAPRASHRRFRAEGTSSSPKELLRTREIAELCHGNTTKSEPRSVIAQRDALQRAQRIAPRE